MPQGWGVFEIALVGSIPDVNFRLKTAAAPSALFPIAVMFFGVMIGAQRVVEVLSISARLPEGPLSVAGECEPFVS